MTVVVPAKDAAGTIADTIRSVQSQTTDDWEVVVVDDHSDDATRDVVLDLSSTDHRIRLVRTRGRGVSCARNTGAAEAAGRSLVFLDADDLVADTWIERLTAPLDGDQGVGATCCGARTVEDGGAARVELPRPQGGLLGDEPCLYLAGTYALRTDIFREIGGFDPELAFGENTDLGIRVNRACRSQGLTVVALDEALLTYRLSRSRSERRDLQRLLATEHTLARYRDDLTDLPETRGLYHRIAAIAAWRIGDRAAARRHARTAAKSWWRDRSSLTTLLGTHVPVLGRRWTRSPRPEEPVAGG